MPSGRKAFQLGFHLLPRLRMNANEDSTPVPSQCEAEELKISNREYAGHLALFSVHGQLQLPFQIRSARFQKPFCGSFTSCQQHDVVRVAYAWHAALFEFLVELIQVDVG
jgi:hypothetical protein